MKETLKMERKHKIYEATIFFFRMQIYYIKDQLNSVAKNKWKIKFQKLPLKVASKIRNN